MRLKAKWVRCIVSYYSAPSEYHLTRITSFGLGAIVLLILGVFVDAAYAGLAIFFLLAAIGWWRRWRRALLLEQGQERNRKKSP
jgi:uncharacterized membrane protein YphA (DoxX/SURF4 family)